VHIKITRNNKCYYKCHYCYEDTAKFQFSAMPGSVVIQSGQVTCTAIYIYSLCEYQWCGLRPSVLGQDRSQTKKIDHGLALYSLGLGLAGLVLCCDTRSCHARRHNDVEGHSNFSSTIYNFSIPWLEHHCSGDQQWRILT